MKMYELLFENPHVDEALNTGAYQYRRIVFFDIFKGDLSAAQADITEYMSQIMKLYSKLDLEDTKACILMILAQVNTIAILAGIDDWEINRFKRNYYLGIESSSKLSELEKINAEFLFDFTRIIQAHVRKHEYSPFVRSLQDYIRQNIEDKLTIPSLADHFHCSTSSLSHRFKGETGCSVMEYILAQKIAVAKPMIRQNLPLSQVASQLSFSSQSHFSNTFHRLTGKTPLEWKRSSDYS